MFVEKAMNLNTTVCYMSENQRIYKSIEKSILVFSRLVALALCNRSDVGCEESNGKDVTVKREMEVTEIVEDAMDRVSW